MKELKKRYFEVDVLRGIAIIMMITFHVLFNLNFFGAFYIPIHEGFLWWFGRGTAVLFLLLVGVSLTLSYSRSVLGKSGEFLFPKYVKRGAIVYGFGLLITLMTAIFLSEGYVVFGILHLIGVSIILAYPFLKLRFVNLFLGLIFISAGIYLQTLTFSFDTLLFVGFIPETFYTVDYFPLLPWFGFILIGIFFGNLSYPGFKRRFRLPDYSKNITVRLMSFLGRHSLGIYLIHQPIIIGILFILGLT